MDPRIKIPGLALLSLSMTECVERDEGEPPPDPIIGDWHAVLIDDEKFPFVETADGYSQQINIELHVEADLDGTLAFAIRYEEDGYFYGQQSGSTLTVDASAAPNYRLDVAHPILEGPIDPYDDSGVITSTGYESGYYGTSYDGPPTTSGDPTTDPTGYDPYGAPPDPTPSRPLQIPLTPHLAPAEMVLACTLDLDKLTCKREGPELPTNWVFERDQEADPTP